MKEMAVTAITKPLASALHDAVHKDDLIKVTQLLKQGANWRERDLPDKNKPIGKSNYSASMNALDVAVVGHRLHIVALILEQANKGKDQGLLQYACNLACRFRFGNILKEFLKYPKLTFTHQAIKAAIAIKDLELFQELRKNGAPLHTASDKSTSILQLSLDASEKDPAFGVSLLNATLLSWHKELDSEKANLDNFKLKEVDLKVVPKALEMQKPEWVNALIEHMSSLAKTLNRKDLEAITNENIWKILTVIAQDACVAILQSARNRVITCLKASDGCLRVNGKWNILHHALLEGKENYLREVYVEYSIDSQRPTPKFKFTNDQQVEIRKTALKTLDDLADVSFDKYGRTYTFRLNRVNKKNKLHQELKQSKGLRKTFLNYSELQVFGVEELGIRLVDWNNEKNQHNSYIQSTWVSKVGYMVLPAVRAVNAITPFGWIQAGLGLAWTFLLPRGKKLFLEKLGKAGGSVARMIGTDPQSAEIYVPYAVDNLVTIVTMPEYYFATTVVSNGVYYAFKDTGYDYAESIAQVACDGVVQSAITGSGSNYELDEKYNHRLNNATTPIFGMLTPLITPIVSTIDSISNKANAVINAPLDALKPYLSTNVLGGVGSSLPMFAPLKKLTEIVGEAHIAKQRVFNLTEEVLLNTMGDSVFKNERLHALQMFKTNGVNTKLYQLNKELEEAKSQEIAIAEKLKTSNQDKKTINPQELKEVQLRAKELQTDIVFQQNLVDLSVQKEDLLYQKTEGYQYHKQWEEKHLAFKTAENDKRLTTAQLTHFKDQASDAWKKCQFYSSESMTKTAEQWGEHVDKLFAASKDNFLDQTNILGEINNIINVAFATSSDRNTIARMISDGYIRKNYPLYPGAGDKAQIEAERLRVFQDITNDKLKGYTHDQKKVKNRLYNYLHSKLTSTPEKHHIPRHQRVLKPMVNEIVGKTFGYIPYPEFKGGRTGNGGVGLQINKSVGQSFQAAVTVAGVPVYNLRSSAKRGTLELTLPKSEVKVALDAKHDANQSTVPGTTKIDMDSPYMKDILATQYKETLGAKVESVGKLPPTNMPVKVRSIGKLPAKVVAPVKSKAPENPEAQSSRKKLQAISEVDKRFSSFIPKITIPGDKANWFKFANLSAQGNDTPEIHLWQKGNVERKQLPFTHLIKDIGNRVIPVRDFMSEVLVESYDEIKDSIKLLEKYAFHEIDLVLSGEELQTVRAIKLLGVFIGTEAARLALKEQTATSQYVKQVAADFMDLSERDKGKAFAKIFIAYKLPSAGMKLISKAGTVSVQKASTGLTKFNKAVDKSAPKPKVPEIDPKPKSLTPHYDLRLTPKFDTIKNSSTASSRFVYTKIGIAKLEAREILRANNIGLTDKQVDTALTCLRKGSAQKINIKIDCFGFMKFSMERSGHTSGFQRMSYKIDLDGQKGPVVQTAFDSKLNLVRQKSISNKNILFDVKKPRVKK